MLQLNYLSECDYFNTFDLFNISYLSYSNITIYMVQLNYLSECGYFNTFNLFNISYMYTFELLQYNHLHGST